MNVLIVGNGKGSWTMRGLQLGAAIGARVTSAPTAVDWAWADGVVLIKRAGADHAAQAHNAKVPIIWDAVDFWRQPLQNGATEDGARAMLLSTIRAMQPALVIGATEAMAKACGGVYLPHHSWSGLTPTPARERVQMVAYEGNALYLGRWHARLETACRARGWTFAVNPSDLRRADMLVAFRDGPWDGWICREWKSGVKAVNAIAAGRPLLSQASAAVRELRPGGSIVETAADLDAALDYWSAADVRADYVRHAETLAAGLTIEAVAARYSAILEQVTRKVSVPC